MTRSLLSTLMLLVTLTALALLGVPLAAFLFRSIAS
jgi:hypothetical protein